MITYTVTINITQKTDTNNSAKSINVFEKDINKKTLKAFMRRIFDLTNSQFFEDDVTD